MSIVRTHVWVTRAKCMCGYFWTTPGSPSVVCACGTCSIDGATVDGDQVLDEVAFKAAVAADLGIPVEALDLVQGS